MNSLLALFLLVMLFSAANAQFGMGGMGMMPFGGIGYGGMGGGVMGISGFGRRRHHHRWRMMNNGYREVGSMMYPGTRMGVMGYRGGMGVGGYSMGGMEDMGMMGGYLGMMGGYYD